jgi:hypothetical protein
MSFYFQVVSPFIASLITSYFAPKKQLVLGITMVIPAITLGIFLKFTYWFLDIPIDYFGFKGEFIVASLYFAIYIPICFVGSLLGYFLYKYMHRQ